MSGIIVNNRIIAFTIDDMELDVLDFEMMLLASFSINGTKDWTIFMIIGIAIVEKNH